MVPQELAVYGRLTARENLEVFGALYGVERARLRERVDWALDWSDLKDRAREPVQRFSGGMRRRLNIACSLLHAPRVVLLDEPTVGVDPQSRERIYEMLAALRQSGVSVVLDHAPSGGSGAALRPHRHHRPRPHRRRRHARGTAASRRSVRRAGIDIHLAREWPAADRLPTGAHLSADRRHLRSEAQHPARDLPVLLEAIAGAGVEVTDLAVTSATLHDVFIALTGRDLRE